MTRLVVRYEYIASYTHISKGYECTVTYLTKRYTWLRLACLTTRHRTLQLEGLQNHHETFHSDQPLTRLPKYKDTDYSKYS